MNELKPKTIIDLIAVILWITGAVILSKLVEYIAFKYGGLGEFIATLLCIPGFFYFMMIKVFSDWISTFFNIKNDIDENKTQ